jgi:hypothetical protein
MNINEYCVNGKSYIDMVLCPNIYLRGGIPVARITGEHLSFTEPRPQEPRPQEPRPQEPRPQEPRPQEPRPQDPRPQEIPTYNREVRTRSS